MSAITSVEDMFERHPEWKLLSLGKLLAVLKQNGIHVKKCEINKYFETKELTQVFKKQPRAELYRIAAPPDSFQIDVALITQYKATNDGIDRMLLLVEVCSRKAFAYPIPSGKMSDILEVYTQFLGEIQRQPRSISGDDFFANKEFKSFNNDRFINTHSSVAKHTHAMLRGNKLGIIDRLTRTLKMYLQKHAIEHDDPKWTGYLQQVTAMYNSTPHAALPDNKSPNDIHADVRAMARIYMQNQRHNTALRKKLHHGMGKGDQVRIAVDRVAFAKEGETFSREIYTIKSTVGYAFEVEGTDGITIPRRYLARDLLKVKACAVDSMVRVRDPILDRARKAHTLSRKLASTRVGLLSYHEAAGLADQELSKKDGIVPQKERRNLRERRKPRVPYSDMDGGASGKHTRDWDWIADRIGAQDYVAILCHEPDGVSLRMPNLPNSVWIARVEQYVGDSGALTGTFLFNSAQSISDALDKSAKDHVVITDESIMAIYNDEELVLDKENIEEIERYIRLALQ